MTWSLGVEEQFYVFFPLLLILWRRLSKRGLSLVLLAITFVSLGVSIHAIHHNIASAFYLLPSRAWELGLGSLLAIGEIDRGSLVRRQWAIEAVALLGLALLGGAVFGYSKATPFPGEYAIVPVVGTVLLIMTPTSWINRFVLGNRLFAAIGLISYSLYLWHWPILSFARIAMDQPLRKPICLALLGLTFIMATLSYSFIERPFRRRTANPKRTLVGYACVVVAMLIPAIIVGKMHGLPGFYDEDVLAVQKTFSAFADEKCLVGYGVVALNGAPDCVTAAAAGEGVALVGDSHASALSAGLLQLAHAKGLDLHILVKSSCPFLLGVTRYLGLHPDHGQECVAFQESVIRYLAARPEIKTIIVAGFWNAPNHDRADGLVSRYVAASPGSDASNTALLRQGVAGALEQLKAMGRRVILVQDVPFLSYDPVRRFALEHMPFRFRLAQWVGWEAHYASEPDATRPLIEAIARSEDVPVVDPYLSLCEEGKCKYLDEQRILYVDPQHLSPLGSAMVARLFAPLL